MNPLKQLQNPHLRASTTSTLTTSQALPHSGLKFIDNSQGCSAAIVELSGLLDVALDKLDFEGEPGDQLQLQLKRLYNEAGTYSNSYLRDGGSGINQWNCSRHEAQIISAAWAGSAAAYEESATPFLPGFDFETKAIISPSIAGTTKATAIYLATASGSKVIDSSPLLPMLVIAIRGTASRVDKMVNMNGDSKEFILPRIQDFGADAEPVYAHAGFLNAANDLEPVLAKKIKEILVYNEVKHVLFTGHSAGGAVASLLFAKYLFRAKSDYSSLIFSSISFGAPPVTRPSLHSYILAPNSPQAKHRGLCLSIVNEYDLVPRTDGAYIRSLVDLYRSIYGLPPIQDDSSSHHSENVHAESTLSLPRFSFEKQEMVDMGKEILWPVPKPVYWHVGRIVVFKTELVEGESEDEEDELLLNIVSARPEEFAKLLWCNCAVHRRVRYAERISLLAEGQFNGKAKW